MTSSPNITGPILVVGDSFTTKQPPGPQAWPELLSSRIGVPVINRAVNGAGYLAFGEPYNTPPGNTYPFSRQLLSRPLPDPSLVIVSGSCNDRNAQFTDLRMRAMSTLSLVSLAYPNAKLLVIGPQWSGMDPPPSGVLTARTAVYEGAQGVPLDAYLDPISPGAFWFPPNRPDWWVGDKFHPNALGHEHYCDKVEVTVRSLLGI